MSDNAVVAPARTATVDGSISFASPLQPNDEVEVRLVERGDPVSADPIGHEIIPPPIAPEQPFRVPYAPELVVDSGNYAIQVVVYGSAIPVSASKQHPVDLKTDRVPLQLDELELESLVAEREPTN